MYSVYENLYISLPGTDCLVLFCFCTTQKTVEVPSSATVNYDLFVFGLCQNLVGSQHLLFSLFYSRLMRLSLGPDILVSGPHSYMIP